MFDLIIVGAGTAGLSAAIYGVRAGKSVLVLEGAAYGGQIINTPEIENYPGIKKISGFEFATNLYNQAKELGAEIRFEKVLSVQEKNGHKIVVTKDKEYEAKAVILATGAKNRNLGIEKEQELVGKGVSYCATCDGMFYRGKVVAVNGGGNTAVEDATFLSEYVEKVYVIHRRDSFRADKAEVDRLVAKKNVELVLNSTIKALESDASGLTGILVVDKDGKERRIQVDGLFVAIGQAPDNEAFRNEVDLDGKGYISAGEDCSTKTAGIFTAGDCRTKAVRQLATAASDGAVAALAAVNYINGLAL
ncbi:thioredoxin-disulfide reductase [Oribacterium sp. oral taxon 108]|uniref:thioredoxin-disulfide reductase n=1 Tax=Oribacterium sp. oral taxon 108 TaxID=712414 RepID=UPI00020DDEFE|nr:thioredoxin-disulfide reductase [Oribacterium sp. oral taxon 108]EGL38155.1 putative thioredoxin-disulfide reductase [Oribacterium sp. oral taxon 108 str. F0425]